MLSTRSHHPRTACAYPPKTFSEAERTHIVVSTQDFITLDISLVVGSATNVVQVSAEAPLVDPSTASISTDLNQQRLEDIPVLGRNPYITAKLSGVFVNTGNPQFIRFADQNGTSTNFGRRGPGSLKPLPRRRCSHHRHQQPTYRYPTIESIQDVKVQANTYDAQVGRTGGGVFNTLLRSGSNEIHGSIFGETRQGSWLANDFFANREGIPRADSPYYKLGCFAWRPRGYSSCL